MFLGIVTETAMEPQVLPPGEYTVKVIAATLGASKSGNQMLTVLYNFPGQVATKLMTEYYLLPTNSDDPDTLNRKVLALKHLQECFGVTDISDANQLVSLEGRVILRVVPGTAEYPDETNKIQKYIKA